MENLADQLRTCRHLVVVDKSPEIGKQLADLRNRPTNSVTWTNRGTTALRLVPSHYDSTWLVGEQLPDMRGEQLLELIYAIEPDLSVRLVSDWKSLGLEIALHDPARLASDRLDDW